MSVVPYLFFEGCAEEALEFYRQALGAEVTFVMRFKDSPVPCDPSMTPPGSENKIMHATFKIGDSQIMVSDGNCGGQGKFEGFAISINLTDLAAADRMFAALEQGGKVQMPLMETFFSPRFGMVADKFGVSWMIHVMGPQSK